MADEYTPTPITDEEWRAFQAIPDQGYSHRAWLDALIAGRVAARDAEWIEHLTKKGAS